MEEMASLWSHQESIDELKHKIHYKALELEVVKAKANEEINKNTESVKQLLQVLKFVCHERDEARDQIQKLLNKIVPAVNNLMLSECFMIDQLHQHNHNPLIKPSKANSSIAESKSLSDAYNHSSSPVESLFDPVTCPELSNINTGSTLVQDCCQELMLPNSFQSMSNISKIDQATLVIESVIQGKALPQKGNLLQTVMEAGPLLQTLLATSPLPHWQNMSTPSFCNGTKNTKNTMMMKQSQTFVDMSCGGYSSGGCILSFEDVNFNHYKGRMVEGFPRGNNFCLVEKRRRLQ